MAPRVSRRIAVALNVMAILSVPACSSGYDRTTAPSVTYVPIQTKPQVVVRTRVNGTFHGCSYGRIIDFDNGMAFRCAVYDYKYAFRPEVIIVSNDTVIIDGKEYAGYLSF